MNSIQFNFGYGLKLVLIVPLTALIVFMTVYGCTAKTNFKQKEPDYYAALRLVGHRLLLSADDTRSRVMPIEKTADEVYRIRLSPGCAKNWKVILH